MSEDLSLSSYPYLKYAWLLFFLGLFLLCFPLIFSFFFCVLFFFGEVLFSKMLMLINIKCLAKICLFEIYFYNFAVVKTTNHKLKKRTTEQKHSISSVFNAYSKSIIIKKWELRCFLAHKQNNIMVYISGILASAHPNAWFSKACQMSCKDSAYLIVGGG